MWQYTDTVHDHFLNPRNVGVIEDADAVGEVGSLACGDALKLYLKIDNGRIVDARFQTFGCASAIASSSALTELIKGKTVDEALKVTNKEIADYLGGLPKEKMHCSVMGQEALEAAIRNWKGEDVVVQEAGEIICKCFGVTDNTVRRAIWENGLKSLEDIIDYTKAGGACGQCHDKLQALLAETLARIQVKEVDPGGKPTGKAFEEIRPARPKLTNLKRMQLIMQVLENEIRPELQRSGGDVDLVDVDGNKVYVELHGQNQGDAARRQTLTGVIERTLREKVENNIHVFEVSQ